MPILTCEVCDYILITSQALPLVCVCNLMVAIAMEWYIEPKDIQCNEYFTQTAYRMEHCSKSMFTKQLHRKSSFKEPEGSVKDDKSFRVLLKTSTASFRSCRASFATASFLKACTINGIHWQNILSFTQCKSFYNKYLIQSKIQWLGNARINNAINNYKLPCNI